MGALDANAAWECFNTFSIYEFENFFVTETDEEIIRNNKVKYFTAFRQMLKEKVPRYFDEILDRATNYIYFDVFSTHGPVIVQFKIPEFINELQVLMKDNEELQHHFNPRYGECNIYTFNLVKDDITFSIFDALEDTSCIQKYVILGDKDTFIKTS